MTPGTRRKISHFPPRSALHWGMMIGLASLWGSGAWADDAPASARLLGVNEGMLNFCAPRSPTAAAQLRQKIHKLVDGASPSQLAQLRNSHEYREAYDSVSEFVGKVDAHNLARFCAENVTDGH
jgi:hypothetical protein